MSPVVVVWLVFMGGPFQPPLGAQVSSDPPDTTTYVADPGDVVSVGRGAQAAFERRRIRYLPLSHESFGGSCDEVVGRLCTTYGEGEWYPVPEADEIRTSRSELIATLDSLQRLAPGSEWILGQRVWYRHEGGDLEGAWATARACGSVERGWCRALEGFALHALERFEEADSAFADALASMDPEVRRRWTVPRWPIDSKLRDALAELEEDPEGERKLLEHMWTLADPLFLVPGNDRRTEHLARWTVARLRDRARNPFRLSWGADLEELTVRHGWEMGWERSPSRDYSSIDNVVGHKHPEGRDYIPPGEALADLASASAEDLRADRRRPRSLYAPAYAPVLLPMDGQLAVFPRGETTVVVASHFLPEDTTWHADHGHPLPWMEPRGREGEPDRIGLFAYPVGGGRIVDQRRANRSEGALMLEVTTGAYVISAEAFSPARMRAGRMRRGTPARPAPPDVATLSDLIFLEPTPSEPVRLEDALERVLPRASVRPGQRFAIGWEVVGLGFRAETFRFRVAVERTDRSVFNRIGSFLRLSDGPRPMTLSWEEPGPGEPGRAFHYLVLELPDMEPGRYEIRLTLSTAERSDAVTSALLEVSAPR